MSRKSVLSRHANSLVEPELPLRAYFLSVGGALLLLLLAADWVPPAPVTSRLTDSHSALPPIRIHSELERPGSGRQSTPPGLDCARRRLRMISP